MCVVKMYRVMFINYNNNYNLIRFENIYNLTLMLRFRGLRTGE